MDAKKIPTDYWESAKKLTNYWDSVIPQFLKFRSKELLTDGT